MKITDGIELKNFKDKKSKFKIFSELKKIINQKSAVIDCLKNTYRDSYNRKKTISKYRKYSKINLIGMGGSVLGTRSIYNFLSHKIKKKVTFIDNLEKKIKNKSDNSKKELNLIISKSGNTLETITNINIFTKKNQKNIFITQNKKSYLLNLANKLKSEIIHHNNYIGGRYSVLSEVGMLPADLIGLDTKKFRQFNNLIKNKNFINSLVLGVSNVLDFVNKKKTNSVILNYDENSSDLFYWYQQLIAESLGKKNKGLLPIISNMPKDNHSLMQLYLSGPKNNFFTFFFVNAETSLKIINKDLLQTHNYLKNKTLDGIKYAQFKATQKVFEKKNIPFRSFFIKKRNEKTLGELFTFFILETILLCKVMKINPFDQPAVELIKKETKKIFIC